MKYHNTLSRKLLALLTAALLVLGSGSLGIRTQADTVADTAQLILTADLAEAARGDTVTVAVALEGLTTPVDMIGLRINYDPEVFALCGEPSFDPAMAVFSDKTFGLSTPGRVVITVCTAPELGDAAGPLLADGPVCSFQLKIKDAAAVGAASIRLDSQYIRLGYLGHDGMPVSIPCAGQDTALEVIIPIRGIALSRKALELDEGESAPLSVTVEPADTTEDTTALWSSDDDTVATVDQTGKVTAVGGGATTIRVQVGGFTDSCAVTVIPDYILGDTDGDMEVTDWDAIVLERYLAGWDEELVMEAADLDGDGDITDWDAILLNRQLAGW